MDIEVEDFVVQVDRISIGKLIVRYGELSMRCQLVIYKKTNQPWIRMPEIWTSPERKMQFCFWPTKVLSDDFQKIVLKKLFDKYDLSNDKLVELLAKGSSNKKLDRI